MPGCVTVQRDAMIAVLPTFNRSASLSSAVCRRKKLKPAGGGHRRHSSLLTTEAIKITDPRDLKTCRGSEINLRRPLMTEKPAYQDNWFGRLAIRHLSSSIEAITGGKRKEEGYEGLIEMASIITRRNDSKEQQEIVVAALDKAFPASAMAMLKAILPQSKFSRELFAIFTKLFFSWLVGPCEVKESDFQGKREKNVVYIPKCRFLEATNCVGMCTNLCKMPSQNFINNSLGMPTNMIPNFEDKSCEIIFGQHPLADDPALKQPCYRTYFPPKVLPKHAYVIDPPSICLIIKYRQQKAQ